MGSRVGVLIWGSLVCVATLAGPACSRERSLRLRDFQVRQLPSTPPEDLQREFVYKNARLILSGTFRSERVVSPPEGVLVSETTDSLAQVRAAYETAARATGWNVIQSMQKESDFLLMVESPTDRHRRLVTVVARKGPPTEIKVYFRRSEN